MWVWIIKKGWNTVNGKMKRLYFFRLRWAYQLLYAPRLELDLISKARNLRVHPASIGPALHWYYRRQNSKAKYQLIRVIPIPAIQPIDVPLHHGDKPVRFDLDCQRNSLCFSQINSIRFNKFGWAFLGCLIQFMNFNPLRWIPSLCVLFKLLCHTFRDKNLTCVL